MNNLYDEEYIKSLNIKYNHLTMEKYKLYANGQLNANFYVLFSYFKNILDDYLLNNCNLDNVKFKYGVRFDNLNVNDYINFVTDFNNKEIEKIQKFIIENYENIIEYETKKQLCVIGGTDNFQFTNKNIKIPYVFENNNVEELISSNKVLIDIDKVSEKMKSVDKFLPLGTIINIKGSTRFYMIAGFLGRTETNDITDYIICYYPGGSMYFNKYKLINHSDIRNIVSIGYCDEVQKGFLKKLPNAIELIALSDSLEEK